VLAGCVGGVPPVPSLTPGSTSPRPTPTPTPKPTSVPSPTAASTPTPTAAPSSIPSSAPTEPAAPAVPEATQAQAWQACVDASQQLYPEWASYEAFAPGAVTASGAHTYVALVSWTDEFQGKTTSLVTTCEIASDMSVIGLGAQSLG
jgi:outer membrane biosynthesis protein TonB